MQQASDPILDSLSLPETSIIRFVSLQQVMWGRDMYFHCEVDEITFELRFVDCRESRWQIYTHIRDENKPAFPPTDLVNIKIGRNQHRSPAHLLTEHFGLSLVYGDLYLVHGDKVQSFGR